MTVSTLSWDGYFLVASSTAFGETKILSSKINSSVTHTYLRDRLIGFVWIYCFVATSKSCKISINAYIVTGQNWFKARCICWRHYVRDSRKHKDTSSNRRQEVEFNDHVSQMCTKAGRQLNVLQRLEECLDYNSRMDIYKTFIMSNFNYCPVIWMFTSKASLSKLETLQKRALRFVLNDYESTDQHLLHNYNVPGIKILLLRNLAIEVYKCATKINPAYLNEMFNVIKMSIRLAWWFYCRKT